MEFLENTKFMRIFEITSSILILVMTIVIAYVVIAKSDRNIACENTTNEMEVAENTLEKEVEQEIISYQEVYVDIKGAVKKPGVYKLKEDAIINDVIKLAGGLKSNASTKYINLSKKVSNEMVITIFTTSQISKQETSSMKSCICSKEDISDCKNSSVVETKKEETTNTSEDASKTESDVKTDSSSTKVSLNNGTKEELMTLNGIGESKALAIIEYRIKNNGFKSLEELMNIPGVGEKVYDKIKENIKL